jgi:uncharacterized protein (DUF2141 family)
MKYKLIVCTLIACLGTPFVLSQSGSRGTLEIKFKGIRNAEGQVAIGINTSPEGWPEKPQIELQFKKQNLKNGEMTVRVPDLPYGPLAISALDDLDSDQEMKMTLGIPREGFGFSMDPPFKLSAPKYEDCSFQLNQPLQQIEIRFRNNGKEK